MTKIISVFNRGIVTDNQGTIALDISELDILRYYFTIPVKRLKARIHNMPSRYGKLFVELVINSQADKEKIYKELAAIVNAELIVSKQLIRRLTFGKEKGNAI